MSTEGSVLPDVSPCTIIHNDVSFLGMQRVFGGVLQRHVQGVSIRRLPEAHHPRRERKGEGGTKYWGVGIIITELS